MCNGKSELSFVTQRRLKRAKKIPAEAGISSYAQAARMAAQDVRPARQAVRAE